MFAGPERARQSRGGVLLTPIAAGSAIRVRSGGAEQEVGRFPE